MKNLNEMKMLQKDFVEHLRVLTEKYISSLEKSKIQTILLSGSVARGDYFPGKLGGYVDLIVMTKEPNFDKNTIFGKNIEPENGQFWNQRFCIMKMICFQKNLAKSRN
jgi:predicted nucleotidyltransferase